MLPSVLTPYRGVRSGQDALPKSTPANLRRFAETPVVRRAINLVKDKVASMDWQVRVRRGYIAEEVQDANQRLATLRRCLEEPNAADSFRVLWEQVIEDLLVGGFGAVEMETTGDPSHRRKVERRFEYSALCPGDRKTRYGLADSTAG
jgi:hypothetical protein